MYASQLLKGPPLVGRLFLEWVVGISVEKLLTQVPLREADAATIFLGTAEAVTVLHSAHRAHPGFVLSPCVPLLILIGLCCMCCGVAQASSQRT